MAHKGFTTSIYRPEYGQGIANCFRAIYGEEYYIKEIYDPTALKKKFELGDLFFAVALNDNNEVVGCEAVYRSSPPFPLIYEAGAGVVLPAYRGMGIQYVLLDVLIDHLKTHTIVEEIFGEAVCNHTIIQKMMCDKGAIETAIEVEPISEETFAREGIGTGRVSTLIQFIRIKDRAQEIYVPQCYREAFEMLYSDMYRERRFTPGDSALPSDVVTQGDVSVFQRAGVSRLTLSKLGNDLSGFMKNHHISMRSRNMNILQVFLPLDQPCIGEAIRVLRSMGYFLGGILPHWFGCDGMLMQRIPQNPVWNNIKLFSTRANKILETVQKDWEETCLFMQMSP